MVELASPPGYSSVSTLSQEVVNKQQDASLITKRSWDIAVAPLKQIPMNLFIMYMAGSSISIFPIMMVGMMLVRPLRAILSLNSSFSALESAQSINLLAQKFVFCIGQFVCLCLALYKCQGMGLLPTHPSDWLDFIAPRERTEFASGGLSYT
ncbi:ER membrane protein complex subunit 4-like [Artemia franciscana]|uniref:ER membrane protein complex subunit 4-like n=1 Tax=Artemia franciscana TaxID=6661 RepID=UPI0032D9F636